MTRIRVLLGISGAVLLAWFGTLGVLVHRGPPALDRGIARALQGAWRTASGQVAGVISDVLGPILPVLLGCGLLVTALVRYRRGDRWHAGLLLRAAAMLVVCRSISFVGKPMFDRIRPRPYPDFSYPSGHVVSVASAGFVSAVLAAWLAPRMLRKLVPLAMLATALSAASRLALGVHWLTDTVGSVLGVLGLGLLASLVLRLLPASGPRTRRPSSSAAPVDEAA